MPILCLNLHISHFCQTFCDAGYQVECEPTIATFTAKPTHQPLYIPHHLLTITINQICQWTKTSKIMKVYCLSNETNIQKFTQFMDYEQSGNSIITKLYWLFSLPKSLKMINPLPTPLIYWCIWTKSSSTISAYSHYLHQQWPLNWMARSCYHCCPLTPFHANGNNQRTYQANTTTQNFHIKPTKEGKLMQKASIPKTTNKTHQSPSSALQPLQTKQIKQFTMTWQENLHIA